MIEDWPEGYAFDVYMKVCDGGCYYLLGEKEKVLAAIVEDYVPHSIIPGDYGDYVDLKIDGSGRIKNWKVPKETDFERFHD